MMLLGMLLLSLAQPVDDAANPAAAPINIVIVLADDLGYGDPGCYNDQSKIPTPNIDRLAAEGLRFTDAHTPSSVCSPTRYGLLTGRYAWRTKLKRSVLWPWSLPLIEQDRLTLPAMLQQHGYHTACIGKWHLGWDWPIDVDGHVSDEFDGVAIAANKRVPLGKRIDFSRPIASGPTSRGFNYYFGDDVPNFPPRCFIENDRSVGIPSVDRPKGMFGHDGPTLAGWDLSVVLADSRPKSRRLHRAACQASRATVLSLRSADRSPYPHRAIATLCRQERGGDLRRFRPRGRLGTRPGSGSARSYRRRGSHPRHLHQRQRFTAAKRRQHEWPDRLGEEVRPRPIAAVARHEIGRLGSRPSRALRGALARKNTCR